MADVHNKSQPIHPWTCLLLLQQNCFIPHFKLHFASVCTLHCFFFIFHFTTIYILSKCTLYTSYTAFCMTLCTTLCITISITVQKIHTCALSEFSIGCSFAFQVTSYICVTFFTLLYTLHIAHWTFSIAHSTFHTAHYTLQIAHSTLHTTLHYLNYTYTIRSYIYYIALQLLHYTTLHYITLRYATLHHIISHESLQDTTLHYIALHCIASHRFALYCIHIHKLKDIHQYCNLEYIQHKCVRAMYLYRIYIYIYIYTYFGFLCVCVSACI